MQCLEVFPLCFLWRITGSGLLLVFIPFSMMIISFFKKTNWSLFLLSLKHCPTFTSALLLALLDRLTHSLAFMFSSFWDNYPFRLHPFSLVHCCSRVSPTPGFRLLISALPLIYRTNVCICLLFEPWLYLNLGINPTLALSQEITPDKSHFITVATPTLTIPYIGGGGGRWEVKMIHILCRKYIYWHNKRVGIWAWFPNKYRIYKRVIWLSNDKHVSL